MTKQEKIIEAYGEYWEEVKDYVDENGWLNKIVFNLKELRYEDLNTSCIHKNGYCLPEMLVGIENNNGWIKIESEKDLPEEELVYHTIHKEGFEEIRPYWDSYKKQWMDKITHYQKIIKPKPPVY